MFVLLLHHNEPLLELVEIALRVDHLLVERLQLPLQVLGLTDVMLALFVVNERIMYIRNRQVIIRHFERIFLLHFRSVCLLLALFPNSDYNLQEIYDLKNVNVLETNLNNFLIGRFKTL